MREAEGGRGVWMGRHGASCVRADTREMEQQAQVSGREHPFGHPDASHTVFISIPT